jgi:DNA polymerase-3 subunit alpha
MIAMNALYRPGPMNNIPSYIRRKQGREEVTYHHPLLEPILKETHGIIVYQEQVMQIARDLGGYTMGGAELFREAMGKKKPDVMAEERQSFLKGCAAHGIDEATATEIFNEMEAFAGYGFPKSHATPYAYVAYQTAYLKAHCPSEFMAANLTSEMEDTDRVATLIDACHHMGIEVLPPDVNESDASFTVVKGGIRFGLGAIRNVGRGAIESIVAARENDGPFRTLFDLCERVDQRALNRRVLESLVQAGAMDSLKGHRAQLLQAIDKAAEAGQAVQAARASGQTSLFEVPQAHKDNALNHHVLPDMKPWTKSELLGHEKEMLGFYVSGHPLEKYEDDLRAFATHTTETLGSASDSEEISLGGIVTSVRTTTDRLGRPMSFVGVADSFGATEVIVFADVYEKHRELLEVDTMVMVKGSPSSKGAERPKIRARELTPLKGIRERCARAVHMSLSSAGLGSDAVEGLRGIADAHPGKCSLLFHLKTTDFGEVTIRSGSPRVSPSDDLLSGFRRIVGSESVWLS